MYVFTVRTNLFRTILRVRYIYLSTLCTHDKWYICIYVYYIYRYKCTSTHYNIEYYHRYHVVGTTAHEILHLSLYHFFFFIKNVFFYRFSGYIIITWNRLNINMYYYIFWSLALGRGRKRNALTHAASRIGAGGSR